MPKYNIAATLPLTLWVPVEADNREEAIEKAKAVVKETPLEDFGCDFSTTGYDIVNED